jgi:hypothetical protein
MSHHPSSQEAISSSTRDVVEECQRSLLHVSSDSLATLLLQGRGMRKVASRAGSALPIDIATLPPS